MEFDLTKVEFSLHDIKKGVKVPNKLSEELAEDVGFHIGDGYMKYRADGSHYEFHYSGGIDDINYFQNVLIPRKFKLFRIENICIQRSKKTNEIIYRFYSKAMLTFYKNVLGVEESPKNHISIPEWIFSNKNFQIAFIRGLADSDGSLSLKRRHKQVPYYPVVAISMKSENLLRGVSLTLKNLDFKFTSYRSNHRKNNTDYYVFQVDINGVKSLEKWMTLVGFKNEKYLVKYKKWAERESNLGSQCIT